MEFVLAFLSLVVTVYGTLNKALLDSNAVGGKCLDGTPAGYYYEAPPKGSNGTLWVIYLEGGGMCDSEASCKQRATTIYGSSTNWPPFITGEASYSSSATENPYFYDGHHVFVPYCAGDVHSGQRTTPSPETWGYYFDGHLIVDNVINDLIAKYKIDEASNVLLTGCSAGGLGTFANLDYVQTKLGSKVTVKGAPVAGYFFANNCTDEQDALWAPPNDYPHYESGTQGGIGHDNSTTVLWDSYLHPDCVAANEAEAWHCESASVAYQYIKTPLFINENQFDSQQIVTEMLMPNEKNSKTKEYVAYFGENMMRSIQQVGVKGNKQNGVFFASCYDHCTGLQIGNGATTKIKGMDTTDLTGDWFWEYNKLPHIVIDDCTSSDGLPCNPTCAGF